MASYGDAYTYTVQTVFTGEAEVRTAVQEIDRLKKATKESAEAAKQAAKDAARAAREELQAKREAAREAARVAREQARAEAAARREAAREAQRAASEQARAAREAAREQARAAREAARAAQDAARQKAAAARMAADATKKAAAEEARANREAARATEEAARRRQAVIGSLSMQISTIADDIQYGARGIQNNVSGAIAALGGYTPAAQLAAGASSLLIGLNREWIDSMLAAAGILDENLVKGLDKAKEKSEELAESAGLVSKALDQQGEAADRWAASLAAVSDKISNDLLDQALNQLAHQTPLLSGEMQQLGERIEEAKEKAAAAAEASRGFGAEAEGAAGAAAFWNGEVARLAKEFQALNVQIEAKAQEAAKGFRAQLDAGGESADQLIDRLAALRGEGDQLVRTLRDAALGTDRWKQEQKEFADAIREHEAALKARRETIEEEADAFAEALLKEAEAAEEAAQRKINAEREANLQIQEMRREANRQRLDERSQAVARAFEQQLAPGIEGSLRQGVAGGLSVDMAIERTRTQAFEVMRRTGVDAQAADRAARALVEAQAEFLREQVNQNEATFRLLMLQFQRGTIAARQNAVRGREMMRAQILQGNPMNGRW